MGGRDGGEAVEAGERRERVDQALGAVVGVVPETLHEGGRVGAVPTFADGVETGQDVGLVLGEVVVARLPGDLQDGGAALAVVVVAGGVQVG
ncbi:hypothetical protein [Streptomyces sp. NBC_00448]|uniref:hypothetical protein n=1 Tax=Streptomyces sp. NBC_00448 TaxID=2903652 RepID=UPI002E1FB4D9